MIGWLGAISSAAAAGAAFVIGRRVYRRGMAQAEHAYGMMVSAAKTPARRFNPDEISTLPEIARRYFMHAVDPGTPLYSTVALEMEGTFLLGSKGRFQTYKMAARQVLRPPDQFVWIPRMRSGRVTISGSDALVGDKAWTRFWLLDLLPVAQADSSPDTIRSASFRAAVEGALWLPTTLLPRNGVCWEQIGPDRARVTMGYFDPAIILELVLDHRGRVQELVGQRWSNANEAKSFRMQPFGGTMGAERSYQGLTIPVEIAVGNHYGTDDYLPFFQSKVTAARYS